MKSSINLIIWVICGYFTLVNCCSTKNDYHYNVVECNDTHIKTLGDYILSKLQSTRSLKSSTCNSENMNFLTIAPFKQSHDKYDAKSLSAAWLYKQTNEPGTTFGGAEATLEALRNEATWNVLVDKKFSVQRYILRNTTNGEITVKYLSDEELMDKISNEMYWDHFDIVQCDNFLYYLSKEFKNQLISFTVIDRTNSNAEMRFTLKSYGIGGFFKKSD